MYIYAPWHCCEKVYRARLYISHSVEMTYILKLFIPNFVFVRQAVLQQIQQL